MHELGLVINIVKQVEEYMEENDLSCVEKLVLQVGQLSEVYPKYLRDVYPIAVESTKLEKTALEIEETPGIGRCKSCDFVYNLVENDNICPVCDAKNYEVIRGGEFMIKELHAY